MYQYNRCALTPQIGSCELPGRLRGEIYRDFLRDDLPVLLEDVPIAVRRTMWLQHDGASVHAHRIVKAHLNDAFPNRWIGRGGVVHWPARSPDLNPLDFFLWGHYKAVVYGRTLPANQEDLMNRIDRASESVTADMLECCMDNMLKRARTCIEVRGGHFQHLLK